MKTISTNEHLTIVSNATRNVKTILLAELTEKEIQTLVQDDMGLQGKTYLSECMGLVLFKLHWKFTKLGCEG